MTGNTYQDGACIFQIIRLLDTIDTRSVFIQYASRLEKIVSRILSSVL